MIALLIAAALVAGVPDDPSCSLPGDTSCGASSAPAEVVSDPTSPGPGQPPGPAPATPSDEPPAAEPSPAIATCEAIDPTGPTAAPDPSTPRAPELASTGPGDVSWRLVGASAVFVAVGLVLELVAGRLRRPRARHRR